MSKSVTLGGQTLHGLDRFGSWRVLGMEGWGSSPAEKTTSEPRPLADGDYDAEVFYGPRLVTLNGRLAAKSAEYAFDAREKLSALLRTPARMQVEQFGMTRWAEARRGRIVPGELKGRHLPFQMELRFIDPFKYGKVHAVGGSDTSPASLFQRGTVPAWPVVTVTGSAAGYTLTLNGRSVTVTRYINANNHTHEIDFRTGILRINGAVVAGGFGAVNFAQINPGLAQNMSVTPVSGSAAISVAYHDTYI
ncbi:hypothetical protein [Glutamicibacter arilaitensis]|uniref:hypothetical protein n=1 Tax=Glutamicibacter arilaitensis TaxID=256701 RepID=UPI00384C67B2